MGDGLGLAVERLRRSKAKSRVVILLTDGVSNAGVIEPNRPPNSPRKRHQSLLCWRRHTGHGPGSDDRSFWPRSLPQPVEIDEETLKEIAERTGGRYFRAVDKDSLESSTAKSTSWNAPRSPKCDICNMPSTLLTLWCRIRLDGYRFTSERFIVSKAAMNNFHFADTNWIHAVWLVSGASALLVILELRGRRILELFVSRLLQPRLGHRPSTLRRMHFVWPYWPC